MERCGSKNFGSELTEGGLEGGEGGPEDGGGVVSVVEGGELGKKFVVVREHFRAESWEKSLLLVFEKPWLQKKCSNSCCPIFNVLNLLAENIPSDVKGNVKHLSLLDSLR
ncbi:hypothetical protein RJT34_27763 [Clitoria ternatea]|uniref:Uncharacterized protein n=1 Tax=Clitoria ternatea TaxID=43366 RepID=A0AAN9I9W8_CLITE